MLSSNVGTTARELRSIQSFQTLDHPYLVKTHAVWSVPGYIVTAMELAEATLLDLMLVYHNDLGQHIPLPQLCLHMWQVGEALDFLNARRHLLEGRRVGFQHGDIKPNNVLLFGDAAKLTDYGLATPTYGPSTPCPRHGTRDYAAPEVLQGYQSDTSDQFSLAVTYHVLRTGTFPFPPAPVGDLPKSFSRPAPDLSLLTAAEQAVLLRALAPAAQDRFPTCQELTRGLLKAHGLKPVRGDEGGWNVIPDDETVPDGLRSRTRSRLGLKRPG
jgi:serine/threonine protein kinase